LKNGLGKAESLRERLLGDTKDDGTQKLVGAMETPQKINHQSIKIVKQLSSMAEYFRKQWVVAGELSSNGLLKSVCVARQITVALWHAGQRMWSKQGKA